MKYIFNIILILIFPFSLMGERYSAYKISSGVTVFNKGKNSFIPLEKRAPLNLADILKIPAGGCVSVLDNESSQIIHCNESGEINLKTLIDHAKANNNKIIKHLNSEIVASKNKKNSKSSSSIAALGVGTRGLSSAKYHQKIADVIKGAAINPPACQDGPLLKLQKDDEGLISFQVINPTERELQINIAKIDTVRNQISLCFLFDEAAVAENLLISPGETIDYSHFSFAPLTDDEILVPFATENRYNPVALNRVLKNSAVYKPSHPIDNSIFIFKII